MKTWTLGMAANGRTAVCEIEFHPKYFKTPNVIKVRLSFTADEVGKAICAGAARSNCSLMA